MYVVGTAGHVDHGKSTLVKTLTGIDPDRWEEERRREMTIDLGFAWLTLPGGRQVSLVDVPGHERFIKNMLAGVGGIDAAMLVIAADESLMPQTEEHLAILDLLGLSHGLVAISKIDLVDEEWLALVQEEVAGRLHGTSLSGAPLVPVSVRSGVGLDLLLATLDRVLDETPSRAGQSGAPRLSIDRAFTIGGFGTVVTGTLIDGPLEVGQEVTILPSGLRARVRGLQSHKERGERALPGRRVAVNLTGIHHSELRRGDMLVLPDTLQPTSLLDLQVRSVRNLGQPLTQNMAFDLFIGAAEVRCRATLLDQEELHAGESGWVQLRLDQPVAAARGDRCILRLPSPSSTVCGGVVVDPHPPRHRRFRQEVISALETFARGTPAELLLQALGEGPPRQRDELAGSASLGLRLAEEGLTQLIADGHVLDLGRDMVIATAGWQRLQAQIESALRGYHRRFPLRAGMPREELRQRLKLDARALAALVEAASRRGAIVAEEATLRLADYTAAPTPEQQRAIDTQLSAMRRSPYSPPTPDLDAELIAWMLDRNLIVRVGPDIYFLAETYKEMVAWVRSTIASQGQTSVSELRDRFGTSRKYALAFLEHLDERKITRRSGDVRILY